MNERMPLLGRIKEDLIARFGNRPQGGMSIDLNLLSSSVQREVVQFGYLHDPWLLSEGIAPTKILVEFMERQGSINGLLELRRLQGLTDKGQFRPGNQVQRELEYTRYLKLLGEASTLEMHRKFQTVKFLPSDSIKTEREERARMRQEQ